MRSIMLTIIIALMLATAASATWLYQGKDFARSWYQGEESSFQWADTTTIELTCGTANGDTLGWGPLLGSFGDTDSYNDLLLMCGPDSSVAAPHMIMITDDLEQTDQVTIVSDGDIENDYLPYSRCEYDGDVNTQEFCVLNYEDVTPGTGFDSFSIIIYSYDITGTQEFTKIHEWFLNETGADITTDNGTFTVQPDLSDISGRTAIDCFTLDDNVCLVTNGKDSFMTNMTDNNTVHWWVQHSPPVDYLNPTGSPSRYAMPVVWFTDLEYYVVNATPAVKVYNITDGSLLREFDISGGDDLPNYFTVVDCDAPDCGSGAEIITMDFDEHDVYLYSADDGDQIESMTWSGSWDWGLAWIEDHDEDGTEELCAVSIDYTESGAGDSHIKCEELNFFALDTIDEDITLDTTSDISAGYPVRIATSSGVTEYIISGSNIIVVGASVAAASTITSLNDSLAGGANINSIYGLYDQASESLGTLISWASAANNDTIWITTSGAVEEVTVNDKPYFRTDTGFHPPYAAVWEILSDGTFYYNGSLWLPSDMPPFCTNATDIEWFCGYQTSCIYDTDFDPYKYQIDCFGDGTQTFTTGEIINFQQADISCDPYLVGAGNYTMVWNVSDSENTFEDADSYSVSFEVYDSADCISGIQDVFSNQLPYFIDGPQPNKAQPYCSEGQGVIYNCTPENDCYADPEDDPLLFLSIDCDGDGVFEGSSTSGIFSCWYNDTSIGHTAVQVVTSGTPGYGPIYEKPVIVSSAEPVCESLTDVPVWLDGPSYDIPLPFCNSQDVTFSCYQDGCYFDPRLGVTDLQIDCDSDGTYEDISYAAEDHNFTCTINSTQEQLSMTLKLRNSAGNSIPVQYVFEVSNATDCGSQSDKDAYTEASYNAIYRFFSSFGGIFGMSAATAGYIFIIILLVSVFWFGYKAQLKAVPILAIIIGAVSETVLVLSGVHSALIIIIMLVIAALGISYRIFVGQPTGG